jgi:predicted nucleotidyltransferase
MAKKYSSYDQINADLEMLKLEKEIYLQHILLNIDKTKESLQPENLFREALASLQLKLSNSYGMILQIAIPYIINWLINKKRGD